MDELGEFHHAEDRPDKAKKIVAMIAMALIVAGAAFYVFESGMLTCRAAMLATFPLLAIWNTRATTPGRSSKSIVSPRFRSCFHCGAIDLFALAGRLAGI
jgi:hypothetical protein